MIELRSRREVNENFTAHNFRGIRFRSSSTCPHATIIFIVFSWTWMVLLLKWLDLRNAYLLSLSVKYYEFRCRFQDLNSNSLTSRLKERWKKTVNIFKWTAKIVYIACPPVPKFVIQKAVFHPPKRCHYYFLIGEEVRSYHMRHFMVLCFEATAFDLRTILLLIEGCIHFIFPIQLDMHDI